MSPAAARPISAVWVSAMCSVGRGEVCSGGDYGPARGAAHPPICVSLCRRSVRGRRAEASTPGRVRPVRRGANRPEMPGGYPGRNGYPMSARRPYERFRVVEPEACRPGPVDRGPGARVRPPSGPETARGMPGTKRLPHGGPDTPWSVSFARVASPRSGTRRPKDRGRGSRPSGAGNRPHDTRGEANTL